MYHFAGLENVQVVHGKIVSADIKKKTNIEKDSYNSID